MSAVLGIMGTMKRFTRIQWVQQSLSLEKQIILLLGLLVLTTTAFSPVATRRTALYWAARHSQRLSSLPQRRKRKIEHIPQLSKPGTALFSSMVDQVRLSFLTVPRHDEDADQEYYFRLVYRFLPRQARKPPLVVLHGAPSLPSSYLYPLADLGGFRSILFYDQLGCGKSDEPDGAVLQNKFLTTAWAVRDLERLLVEVLGTRTPYHLYGHSYGGCLAYEFLRNASPALTRQCRSVVLSSAPTCIPAAQEEYQRLVSDLGPAQFAMTHVCRQVPVPSMLAAAYQYPGRKWIGLQHMADYEAAPTAQRLGTPCLALRGAHDFTPASAVNAWKDHFRQIKVETNVDGCSHHGLYENPAVYGDILRNFWLQHDM